MSALRDWYTRHNPGTVSGTGGDVKLSPDQVNSLASFALVRILRRLISEHSKAASRPREGKRLRQLVRAALFFAAIGDSDHFGLHNQFWFPELDIASSRLSQA